MFGYTTHRLAGLETVLNADGTKTERDLKKCVHCGVIWKHDDASHHGHDFCIKCMGECCTPRCHAQCYPHEQQIMDESAVMQALHIDPLLLHGSDKLIGIAARLREHQKLTEVFKQLKTG